MKSKKSFLVSFELVLDVQAEAVLWEGFVDIPFLLLWACVDHPELTVHRYVQPPFPPSHWPAQSPHLPVSMGDLIVKCISELFSNGIKRVGMDTHNSLMACTNLAPVITSLQ